MMLLVLAASIVWPSGIGASGSGSQAGVCSGDSESESLWVCGCAASKMEEEQGCIPAVV